MKSVVDKEYAMQLVKAGKQLMAIRFLMEQTNVSLREAHDLIETWTEEADNISGFESQEMVQYTGQRPEKQNEPRKSRTGLKIIWSLFLIILSSSLLLYAIVTDRLVFHGNLTSWPIELLYIPIIALVLMWIPSDIKRRSAGQKWLFGILFGFILIILIFGGIFGMVILVNHFK
jgi:hypothetical protein